MHRLAFSNLVAWIAVILTALTGFVVSLFQDRQLKAPRFYLLYCGLAGSIQLYIWFYHPELSWYWAFELANDVLLCLMSVEILSVLRSWKTVVLFSIPCLGTVALLIADVLPTTTRVEASLKTIIIGGILLAVVLSQSKNWTYESRWTAWGIFLLLALDGISSWAWLGRWLGRWGGVFFNQLSPLPGLVFLILAGKKKRIVLRWPP